MKLYSGDLSPYSAKVRLQIYAKGLDITLERPAGFGTAEWWKTSPIGRIPVLELDNGDLIPESRGDLRVSRRNLPDTAPAGIYAARIGDHPHRFADRRHLPDEQHVHAVWPDQPKTRSDAVRDLLAGQVVRNVKALEHYIGSDGFAVCGRLTIADCSLVPALFLIENVLPSTDTENPIPGQPKVAAYWAAIRQNEFAAKVLVELYVAWKNAAN